MVKRAIKRISVSAVILCLVAGLIPSGAFAVDPVSAATMANAFAQAITAYGASQGVSISFDVTSTDGIGQGVHDLWDQYQADMSNSSVTVSDYQDLASSAFPSLWKKTFNYITVNLDAATRGEIDGFWNWLLSGPAELTKVDNQYYEWTLNQNDSVDPIVVADISALGAPIPYIPNASANASTFNSSRILVTNPGRYIGLGAYNSSSSSKIYVCFILQSESGTNITVKNAAFSKDQYSTVYLIEDYGSFYRNNNSFYLSSLISNGIYGGMYGNNYGLDLSVQNLSAPVYNSVSDAVNALSSSIGSLSVQPYIGDSVPQDVYIPDNTDVNYEPLPVEIPLDIPWDDTLFGDGTGTLTDAESEAVTGVVSDAIVDSDVKTLELADTINPPSPSPPSEVFNPLLPVTLPSFNFSFSGIWHYVRDWVSSLGSFLSMVFAVWSELPYVMVVPVYATAVILIVFGVYKRFFQ